MSKVVPKINIIIDNFNIQQEVFKIIHNARLEFLSAIISLLLWSVTRSVGKHGFSNIEKVKKIKYEFWQLWDIRAYHIVRKCLKINYVLT